MRNRSSTTCLYILQKAKKKFYILRKICSNITDTKLKCCKQVANFCSPYKQYKLSKLYPYVSKFIVNSKENIFFYISIKDIPYIYKFIEQVIELRKEDFSWQLYTDSVNFISQIIML